ncbi:single hybrid motif-containing protein [Suillus lakei]|nr:single hybrid motif-containing protein [Suillus lakei]
MVADSQMRRAQFHSSHLLQAETVKVPQMAESISEGTLRSWSKQVGDSVEADEEVATIETDKIDVSVNAPKSGKIVELLAKEDDTVSVGQDLFRIEPGEGGASPAPQEQKKVDPEEPKDQQVDKTTPESPAPSVADKQSDGIPPEGPKESKKEVKQDSKPKEVKSKAPAAPKAPGSRG